MPFSHKMRDTMGSRPGASGFSTSPFQRRLFKTAPAGRPCPILATTSCWPSGVRLLPGLSPTPNFEVEIL